MAVALIKQGYGMPQAPGPEPSAFRILYREKEHPLESQRLTMTSLPSNGGASKQSTQMPMPGRLVGIEMFVDSPASGDYTFASLRDKGLFDRLFVDLAKRTSYRVRLDEEVETGDLLTVGYFSVDGTSKTFTWTPTFREKVQA